MTQQITLYTAKISSHSHRVEIAFAEAKVPHKRFEINLVNKPDWYAPQVNPASKVPAITYGGPDVPPDQPSPESVKLPESIVLLEFTADLFPDSGLLPKDPVQRAKVRLFIDALQTRVTTTQFMFIARGVGTSEDLFGAYEHIQSLLPPQGFVLGEQFSIADAAAAPLVLRCILLFKHDLGHWPEGSGEGPKLLAVLQSQRFARLWEYYLALLARPSVAATWDEELNVKHFTATFKRTGVKV